MQSFFPSVDIPKLNRAGTGPRGSARSYCYSDRLNIRLGWWLTNPRYQRSTTTIGTGHSHAERHARFTSWYQERAIWTAPDRWVHDHWKHMRGNLIFFTRVENIRF